MSQVDTDRDGQGAVGMPPGVVGHTHVTTCIKGWPHIVDDEGVPNDLSCWEVCKWFG